MKPLDSACRSLSANLAVAVLLLLGLTAGPIIAASFDLQAEVNQAHKAGGGEVIVPPGVHLLPKGLLLHDTKSVSIVGFDRDQCVLKLAPAAFGKTAGATAAGALEVGLHGSEGIEKGMELHFEADGALDSFTGKPRPYVLGKVASVAGDKVTLTAPLSHPVPSGTSVRDAQAPNLVEITGKSEAIKLRKLTLDGGMLPKSPQLRAHAQLCGVMIQGPYSYERGPHGPGPKDIEITDCIIRNCYGRGVAIYSAEKCLVQTSTFMDTQDEAVDLDHFTKDIIVRDNHIARCRVGIELNDANDCLVAYNEIRDCTSGVHLWRWCKQAGLNEGNQIIGNSLTNISGHGIQLGTGTSANIVSENDIDGCGKSGITLFGTRQKVLKNRIEKTALKPIAIGEGDDTHQISP